MTRLSEAANQTSLALREFNKATGNLREAVGGLKDEVSRFALGTTEGVPIGLSSPQLRPVASNTTSTDEPCCS